MIDPATPSLARTWATCTSTVRVPACAAYPQTDASNSSRVNTRPGRFIRCAEQIELGRRHPDGCAVDEHQPAVGVDEDRADLAYPLAVRHAGRAPEDRLDPGDQLAWAERLGQVVVGAQLQAEDAVDLVVAGGQEDDRCPIAVVAEPAADLEAVQAGQADVEHASDRAQPAGRGETGDAVGLGMHAEVVPREIHPYEIGDRSFVLHDEHETLARAFGHPLMMADRGHEPVIGDVRIVYGSLVCARCATAGLDQNAPAGFIHDGITGSTGFSRRDPAGRNT